MNSNSIKLTVKQSLFVIILLACALCYLRYLSGSKHLMASDAKWYMPAIFFANAWITYVFLIFTVLRSRICAYIIFPIALISQLFFYYVLTRYGTVLESELVTAALETSWKQLSGFIYIKHYIGAPILLVLMFISIYQMRKRLTLPRALSAPFVCSFFFGYALISSALLYAGVNYFPRQTSHLVMSMVPPSGNPALLREQAMHDMERENNIAYIYRLYLPFHHIISAINNTYQYYNAEELIKSESYDSQYIFHEQDLIVVLIIGESYRADHSPLNGYERDILPQTSEHLQNIINIPYMKSYGTTTIASIIGMLSDATCKNQNVTKTSFMGVLEKHGFQTSLCVSNTGYWYNNPRISKIIDKKIHTIFTNKTYDEIESDIADIVKGNGKKFIIIEDGIGHMPYEHDPVFTKFDETLTNGHWLNNINAYDNCLLQADDLIARTIRQLKDKNAVIIYSADHGQSFGEQGYYMHGGLPSVIKQRHVFSFVWHSDLYAEKHPDLVALMKENRNKALSHDYLYHSIISISGIESAVQDPALDITKPLGHPNVTEFSLGDELK